MNHDQPPSSSSNQSDRNTTFLDDVVLLGLVLMIYFWVVNSRLVDVLNFD